MKDLISIIIPVYNGEKYISKCLDSLIVQSYNNIEVIVVDSSTDGTKEILEKYRRMDNRIKVINKTNQGVSFARNKGIMESDGCYISFIDADDYVDKNYIQSLYDEITDEADVVCCGFYQETVRSGEKKMYKLKESFLNLLDETYSYFLEESENHFLSVVWGKLFRRKVVENIRFAAIDYGEDTLFMTKVIGLNYKIKTIDYVGLTHTIHKSSTINKSRRTSVKYVNSMLKMYNLSYKFMRNKSVFCQQQSLHKYKEEVCNTIFSFKRWYYDKENYMKNRNNIKNHIKNLKKYTRLSIKERIIFKVYVYMPHILWILL